MHPMVYVFVTAGTVMLMIVGGIYDRTPCRSMDNIIVQYQLSGSLEYKNKRIARTIGAVYKKIRVVMIVYAKRMQFDGIASDRRMYQFI